MGRSHKLGLWLLVKFTREKAHIWRGLAVVLSKLERWFWIPETPVADLRAHAHGLERDAHRMQRRLDSGDEG